MTIEGPRDEKAYTEFQTRRDLIDKALERLNWARNVDWVDEFELRGMPNHFEVGYADYVLFSDDGRPLAVIEAKRTTSDIAVGRQQAKLYADILENRYKRRPIIFLTNGYDIHIWDDVNYPERRVSDFYSKRDLEKLFNLAAERSSRISDSKINENISGRPYQISAVKAICSEFENKKRKALLVMATGSGKTRTVISLVDVLIRKGWVKNVLFLADRTSLVIQAKRAFNNLMPSLTMTNMSDTDVDLNARCVFSTYQTMINCIDSARDSQGRLAFTCGHFDLIITDEAHRSIYNKYREIFEYFDSLLVGLTATPKDDIDKNTYDIFNLPSGDPTYSYELAQAVSEGYLVDYKSFETKLKFIEEGISYLDLPVEEREEYETLFIEEDGTIPERIDSKKLNEWIFNRDTIVKVLDSVMRNGYKVDYGSKIGKTIIFAKNHNHAEAIYQVFGEEYPSYNKGFCRVIDNYTNYAQSLIDDFSLKDSNPQLVISVDMLDTGIDVPEILNLVFFKKVYSKAKFWQMIGRGTRLCPNLIDGKDKTGFLIFDFCSNFEFFRITPRGFEGKEVLTLQGRIFNLKVGIAFELQKSEHQTKELMAFRCSLVEDLVSKVRELNRENFTVRQHLRFVELYSNPDPFNQLIFNDVKLIAAEVSPLILPYEDDIGAVRFDALMNAIELAHLVNKPNKRFFKELQMKATYLSQQTTIPDVAMRMDTIRMVMKDGYVESADMPALERIRVELREILKYLRAEQKLWCDTHFSDQVLEICINDSELADEGLAKYRERAEHYIRKNQDEEVIKKLRTNRPLDQNDLAELEKILWSEVGTKEEYDSEIGTKPLGVFVREISGLDMKAAQEAFSKYLNSSDINTSQRYFVNQIVEYVVRNGVMSDISVLTESPFTDRGSIAEIFSDMTMWSGIRKVIDQINKNTEVRTD